VSAWSAAAGTDGLSYNVIVIEHVRVHRVKSDKRLLFGRVSLRRGYCIFRFFRFL